LDRGFQYVLVLDADLSHRPRYIPDLLAGMAASDVDGGFDIMIGSRYVPGGGIEGWPWYRRWMSRCLNAYARWLLGLQVRDCSGAFRCYRTDLLRRIGLHNLRSRGFAYLEELLWRAQQAGARIGETPITFVDRQFGQTKINGREALATLAILFRLGLRHHLRI
jgi:dolichol-phosphate mannosyltransferase